MKALASTFIILFCFFLLTSCTYEDMMEKLIPKEEAKLAEDYLTKLREKDFEYIKSQLSDELRSQVSDALLLKLSNYFRDGELLSTEIIGSQVNVINGAWQGNFSFEYHFTNGWNLANTAFRKVNDNYEVIGLNVYQTNMSQKELHAFTLSDKEFKHYIILLLAVLVPIFIIITTYFCARTPITKKKWLWIMFVLVGICAIHINWTTGQYSLQPLSINLFGAAATASGPHAAWTITASFPFGAVIFWFKRKRFIALSKEANKSLNSDAQ